MARLSTKLVRLKRQLAVAERREDYQQTALQAKIDQGVTTAYEGKGTLIQYYVPSITDPAELYIQVSVPESHLTLLLGGSDEASVNELGGTLTLPAGKAYAQQRGFANHYLSIKVTHRDNTPVARLTPWGSRVVDYASEKSGQKSRQLPIGGADMKAINQIWKNLQITIQGTSAPCDVYFLGVDNSIIERKYLAL